jgi:hypothetical protein
MFSLLPYCAPLEASPPVLHASVHPQSVDSASAPAFSLPESAGGGEARSSRGLRALPQLTETNTWKSNVGSLASSDPCVDFAVVAHWAVDALASAASARVHLPHARPWTLWLGSWLGWALRALPALKQQSVANRRRLLWVLKGQRFGNRLLALVGTLLQGLGMCRLETPTPARGARAGEETMDVKSEAEEKEEVCAAALAVLQALSLCRGLELLATDALAPDSASITSTTTTSHNHNNKDKNKNTTITECTAHVRVVRRLEQLPADPLVLAEALGWGLNGTRSGGGKPLRDAGGVGVLLGLWLQDSLPLSVTFFSSTDSHAHLLCKLGEPACACEGEICFC